MNLPILAHHNPALGSGRRASPLGHGRASVKPIRRARIQKRECFLGRVWLPLLISTALTAPVFTRGQNLHPRLNEIVTSSITGPPDEYEADLSNCPVPDCEQWYLDLGPSVYDGDYPDWVEIHNPLAVTVDLEGYGLSDDTTQPFKWVFPRVTIGAGGYLMVFASGKNKVDRYIHTNFELNRSGEQVILTAPSGVRCDEVVTGGIPIDFSMGRRLDSPSEWVPFDRPTPGAENDTEPFLGFTGTLSLSPEAGLYPEAISVTITSSAPESTIRFTRDGSEPVSNSELYAGAISVGQTTVLRARAFHQGHLATPILTESFLIGESSSLPVVSLSTNPDHLWDPDLGIYTPGRNAREADRVANYWQDWERPIHVEFFEPNGGRGFSLDAGVRIFGWGSRSNPQKSLSILFRDRYGAGELDYPLIPGLPVQRFTAFVLRAGGSDATSRGTFFRDPFASALLGQRNLDTQAFRPAIVFINGSYFGIQNIREKMNEDYLATHHGVDPQNVDIISRYWRRTDPVIIEGDAQAYLELEDFLQTNDLSTTASYEHLRRVLDLENFLDYTAAQIWFANYDWPGNNNKVWRNRGPDSPWRVLMYDLDYTCSFNPNQNTASHNTLAHATQPNGTDWPNPSWTTLLIRRLLEVPAIQERFINRLADLMNADFLPETTEAQLDATKALFDPEMPRHLARWAGTGNVIASPSAWRGNIETVRTFLRDRTSNVRSHVQTFFGLTRARPLRLGLVPQDGGRVKINSLLVGASSWSGTYFPGVPISLDALPVAGFRFAGWEGVPASVDPLDPRITLDPADTEAVAARFEPDPDSVNAVVIHEISYHVPAGNDPGDWVELHNSYPLPVDVSGWVMKDSEEGHAFSIPEATVMASGGFLVLCEDASAFSGRFPAATNFLGDLNFALGNGGDQVRLFNARKELVDEVTYEDTAPWPTEADGHGPTLELIRPGSERVAASSWRASNSNSGSPGAPNGRPLSEALAPTLAAALTQGDLSFRFHAEPARTYLIQTSADLHQWTDWRLLIGDGVESRVEVDPPETVARRFYRLTLLR